MAGFRLLLIGALASHVAGEYELGVGGLFHVAFSKTVKNACVFSGQPYHCAVQAFQGEDQVVATPESSVPYCEGCAAGMTLAYDHCKNHPQHVDVGRLPDYPKRACGQNPISPHPPPGCIDLTGNLSESRVFLFHPSMDQCYLDGAVANTAALYSILVAEPQRTVKFVDVQPFPHCLPQNSTPYWGNSSEPSGYDGPGECLKHIYGHETPLAPWGESNDIILLKACVGGHVDVDRFPNSCELQRGLLDVAGQTGLDYSKQFAPHMRFVYAVLQRVLNGVK
ncbi:hypothetical protein JL722_9594 [Aureococcus anophagefferens]|nr:hypothetical protein JL722_9594 [Aureococcus anophagefferens]